jgi:hypothetical protein
VLRARSEQNVLVFIGGIQLIETDFFVSISNFVVDAHVQRAWFFVQYLCVYLPVHVGVLATFRVGPCTECVPARPAPALLLPVE